MKIDRLIAIMMVLLNNEKTNAKALADIFEVSCRTIYRDLDTLLVAGVPITTTQGVNGGVGIEARFKVDKHFFSTTEITNLLVGLNGIESAVGSEGIIAAFEKVKNLVPKDYLDDVLNQTNLIDIDLTTWQGHDSIKDTLKLIKKCLTLSVLISFEYINKKNEISKRMIEPYKLTLKENSWYLEGYCLTKCDFRMFKLSRMLNIEESSTIFVRRDFKPLVHSKVGWIKEKLFLIDVELKTNILEQMLIHCGEDNIYPINKTTYRAKMPFTNDSYSYNKLLSFGENIKCFSPRSVIDGLLTHIKKIESLYK